MPLTFKDSLGREWNCKITVGAARRVKDAVGVDLANVLADKMKDLKRISDSCTELLGVVWEILKPQAVAANPPVSLESFAEAIDGDALEAMSESFVEAIADFSPAHLRAKIMAIMGKAKELRMAEDRDFTQALAKLDPEEISRRRQANVTMAADKLMDELSGGSSTDALPSSAVIPFPSPSES